MGQIATRANTGGNKILKGTTLQKNHNTTKEQLTRNKSLQGTSVQGPTLQRTEYYMDQHYAYNVHETKCYIRNNSMANITTNNTTRTFTRKIYYILLLLYSETPEKDQNNY